MKEFANITRPYWAPGINNQSTVGKRGLKVWLKDGKNYQVHSSILANEFTLDVIDRNYFLRPIAVDCNRFFCSATESLMKVENISILPKSHSWSLIKQYYSAFYAAHAILRCFGTSLTQLDSLQATKIEQISDLYSTRNEVNLERGYYKIDYSLNSRKLVFKKLNIKADGGSHVVLWKIFAETINLIIGKVLSKNPNPSIQPRIAKLAELISNLSYLGSNNYSWLSRTRNRISYRFDHGTWFPYEMPNARIKELNRTNELWKQDIMNIELRNLAGKELTRFSNTCQFITGLSLVIGNDMSKRCSYGKSFLINGHVKLMNVV